MERQAKARSRLLTILVTVAFNCLLTVVLAEVALRLSGYSHQIFYRFDAERGWSLRPNAHGLWTDEGRNEVSINSDGLHDREHEIKKPPNTFRIAMLGDSFAEAVQLPIAQNFSSVAEQTLKQCPLMHGREPEVINFGVAGYGTAQELLTLRSQVWKYSPDMVALAFFTGNDIEDNDPKLPAEHSLAQYRPYFTSEPAGLQLVNPGSYSLQLRLLVWLSAHSRAFQLINDVRHRHFRRGKWRALLDRAAGSPGRSNVSGAPTDAASFLRCSSGGVPLPSVDPAEDPELARAWDVSERLIREIRDEVVAHGAKFLLVIIGNDIQAYPDERVRSQFMAKCKVKVLSYADTRLANFARQNNIEAITMTPPFQAYVRDHDAFLYGFSSGHDRGFGHWNAEGHGLAGHLIADRVCNL